MSDPIVGIDLGTSNTVVAHAGAGSVKVLADSHGYKIHPSVVSFHPNGGVVVGAPAKQRKVIDPKNTIFSVKRLIGRSFDSPEVQTAMRRAPYQIKEGPNQLPLIVTRAGEYAIPEISAIVLDHAKTVATTALGQPVSRAVVTVPASFNDAQRLSTATAGSIAGLSVVRVLNEPTAAALAYGHTRQLHEIIAVYDFGGGTFDITILKLADQVYEVLGTAGDTFLGGDDLDERLVDRMVEKFLVENRLDLRSNEVSMMRLRAVAEQTKIELSRRSRAVVRIDEIAYGPSGRPLDLQIEIARDEFVRQVADIIDRTFPVCEEALQYAQLSIGQIDDIVLVGGTTKIPYVRDQVSKFFSKAPRTDVNPEDAVAVGAALQATSLERILGGKRPSSQHTTMVDPDTQTETLVSAGDSSTAAATLPVPKLDDTTVRGDTDELTFDGLDEPTQEQLSSRKRSTAGYSEQIRAAEPARPNEYRMKGQHRDQLDEKPTTQPIGRIRATAPMPPPVPPAGATARTLVGAGAKTLIGTESAAAPPPPPPARSTQPMPPVPLAPAAAPQAPTIMIEPALPEPASAASTAKGFSPPPAATFPMMPSPVLPSPVVLDVTPRGLGIGTVGGFCEELIQRNSRVPTQIRKLFTTSRDLQQAVRIVVVQGESRRMDRNVVIGDLTLGDLPPRPRGETSIEVTFILDASGILQVRARDAQTGREQRASLDVVGTVPDQDVAASRERLQALRR